MPTSLPDHTTTRRQTVADVTRRTILSLLLPFAPRAPRTRTSTFTALADTDVVQRWLRCSFAARPA